MKLTAYTKTGNKSQRPLTVSDQVFKAKVNRQLLAQAIRVYLANQRQGTSKTKRRSEVKRTKKKWYQQKGTGRARHGSRNAPIFVGGGIAHGPTGQQNWKLSLSQRLKHQALISALSTQLNHVMAWDGLNDLSGKTKEAARMVDQLTNDKDQVLVVLAEMRPETLRSLRNIERVKVVKAERLNAYEVARVDKLIFTKDAAQQLENRLSKYLVHQSSSQAEKKS